VCMCVCVYVCVCGVCGVCVLVCVCVLRNNIFLHGGLTKPFCVIRQYSFLSCMCFNYIVFSFYMFDHSTVFGKNI